VVGRSLLRERSGRRVRALGPCPSCGDVLSGPGECWLDAEHVMTEHLLDCARRREAAPAPELRRQPSQVLRLA